MDIKAIAKSVIDKMDEKQIMEFLQKFADEKTMEKVKGAVGDKGGDILNTAKNLLGGNK